MPLQTFHLTPVLALLNVEIIFCDPVNCVNRVLSESDPLYEFQLATEAQADLPAGVMTSSCHLHSINKCDS